MIEMLVVIAMVVLLALLFLPRSGGSPVQNATCLNNLKQLLAATAMYAAENDNFLPHPNWGFETAYAGWLCKPPYSKPVTNIQTGLLWKYSPHAQLFLCPLDKTNTASFQARRQKYTSYIMNGAACFFEGQPVPRTVQPSSIQADAILFWQADERNFRDYNDGSSKPDEGVTRMHGGGSPVGLISGGVEHMKSPDFNREALKRPGRLWWNPKRPDGGA